MDKYKEIINLPHKQSTKRPHMSLLDRAAQFAPFAALTGHDEAIEEIARLTDNRAELDEYSKEEINRELKFLQDHIDDGIFVNITYFVADKKKTGGKYITKSGFVTKVREFEKDVVLDDGTQIPLDDIFEIDGDELKISERV